MLGVRSYICHFVLIAYQYAIPTTQPKSSSIKAFTYSTIAFGAGKSCVNSLTPSITAIDIIPMTSSASSEPPGPATSRAVPSLLNMPPPITALIAMN